MESQKKPAYYSERLKKYKELQKNGKTFDYILQMQEKCTGLQSYPNRTTFVNTCRDNCDNTISKIPMMFYKNKNYDNYAHQKYMLKYFFYY
jgi:hypothetical protein